MIPEHAADHCRHDGATELVFNIAQLIHQHSIVLLNLRMRTFFDFAHFVDTLNYSAITQIERKHASSTRCQILAEPDFFPLKILCHHTRKNFAVNNKNKNAAIIAALGNPQKTTGAGLYDQHPFVPTYYKNYFKHKSS